VQVGECVKREQVHIRGTMYTKHSVRVNRIAKEQKGVKLPIWFLRMWAIGVTIILLAILYMLLPGHITHGGVGFGVYATEGRGILTVTMLP